MESKSFAVALIILGVAGLGNCSAVKQNLSKINVRISNLQQNILNMQQNIVHLGYENRELRNELDKANNRTSELEIKLDSALKSSLPGNEFIVHFESENRKIRKELDKANNRTSELEIRLDSALSRSYPAITDNGSKDSTVEEKIQKMEGVINLLAADLELLKSKSDSNTNKLEVTVRKAFVKEKAFLRKLNGTIRSKQEVATREVHDFMAKSNKSLERHMEAIENLHNATSDHEEAILEMTAKLGNIITAMGNTDIRISQNEMLLTALSDCGSHKGIPNGDVTGDSFVGGTPVISCNSGYSQTGSARCKAPVFWETDVNCQKDCAELIVANGMANPSSEVPHGTEVTVFCDSGYTIFGNSAVMCNYGDFSGLPRCFKDCAILQVDNGMVTPATTVPHGTTVTVTCDSSYVLVGNNTPVCDKGDFTAVPFCGFSFTDVVVGSRSSFTVRMDEDGSKPSITGAEFLSDGRLILCDFHYQNRGIKLLSKDFSMIDSLKLQADPFDVSAVNSSTVIVTLPYRMQLQYVHVVPHFKPSSSIQLDNMCWGVDVVGNEIFTSCYSSWGSYDGEVKVLDFGGTLQKRLGVRQDSSYVFDAPYYLTVSSNTGYIYVPEEYTNKVTCLSSAGEVVYVYDDPELEYPQGICVDDVGNTIVCCYNSNNIHIITAGGKRHRILLTSSDGLESPSSVAYRHSDATLVIGSLRSNNLLAFHLEN